MKKIGNEKIIESAKILWDYHLLNQKLEKVDLILVLGSSDTRVATKGAELYLEGLAPLLLFSGGSGRNTIKEFTKSEAEVFADVARTMGVPEDDILLEGKSTNTGDNINFTKKLLLNKNVHPKKIIVVSKPYMERRVYAIIKKRWPEMDFIVTSPQISFEDYPTDSKPLNYLINAIVADIQRIKVYPEKGFQIPQDIPDEVWTAYQSLIKAGYTEHLIK